MGVGGEGEGAANKKREKKKCTAKNVKEDKSVGGRRDDGGDAGTPTSPAVCERNEDGFWAPCPAVRQDGG